MRRIEDAASVECRSFCIAEFFGDQRADAAFDLVLVWGAKNPLKRAADRQDLNWYAAHMRRAVDCHGRNLNVCGADWLEWDRIVRGVGSKLLGWLFEVPEPVTLDLETM